MKSQPFTASRAFVAFVLAVTTAAACFTVLQLGIASIVGGVETSTSNDFATKAFHLSAMALFLFIVAWIFAFITSFLPYWCVILFVRGPLITHWLFYVSGAALVSIVTSLYQATLIQIGPALGPMPDIDPTLFEAFLQCAPIQVPSGILAGYLCWRFLFRNIARGVRGT